VNVLGSGEVDFEVDDDADRLARRPEGHDGSTTED
jgi:hypothetical protein